MSITIRVNGTPQQLDVDPEMPLLWYLRDGLQLTGSKFGCGMGLCGACTVPVNGEAARSCLTPMSAAAGKEITTIEGLSENGTHPVQRAWERVQVPQCGYCQSGQIMSAVDLLQHNPKPTRAEIVEHMSTNICRCGTYPRIVRAIERATREA